MTFKLGAKPAKNLPHQPKFDRLAMMARTAPARLIRDHINPGPLMLQNDTLGDCTSAGLANSIRALSALNGFQTAIRDEDAVAFYSASTGYDPSRPESDQGGVEVDVLSYAARQGYALETQTLYPLWGSTDAQDQNAMRMCMAAFGSAYLGVQLAIADQASVGAVWDTDTPAGYGDPTPGSWGGHCLLAYAYTGTSDTDLVTLLTWGTEQKATWRWVRSRIMESHAVLWRQLATPKEGFLSVADFENIRAQNAAFLAGVTSA